MVRRRTGSGSGGDLTSQVPGRVRAPAWGRGRGDGAAWPGPSWVTGPAFSSPPHRRPFFPPRTERQCLPAGCWAPATSSLGWENKAPPTQAEGSGGQGRDGAARCQLGPREPRQKLSVQLRPEAWALGQPPRGQATGREGSSGSAPRLPFPGGSCWGRSKKALNHLSLQSLSLRVSNSPRPYSLKALLGCLGVKISRIRGSSPSKQVRCAAGDSGRHGCSPHSAESPGTPTPQEAPPWSLCQGGVNPRGCLGGQGPGEPSS